MPGSLVVVAVVAFLLLLAVMYIWMAYNMLVTLRVKVDEAWSDITVQLKRRADLIPNVVEAVKGYASHEKGVFEAVTQARAETISAQTPAEAAIAEGHLQQALKSIFAVAEAYPQLQASQNFLQLQSELVETENKIQASRRFYNGGVREYNTKLQIFPNNLIAKSFRFSLREFFEVEDLAAISEPPRIQF
jgi:LemA protein